MAQLNTAIAGTEFEHAALPSWWPPRRPTRRTRASATSRRRCGTTSSGAASAAAGGGAAEQLQQWLEPEFGSFDGFVDRFASRGARVGSGWTWLVLDGALTPRVVVPFAGCHPLSAGMTPILAIDLWEHARVLDYPAAATRTSARSSRTPSTGPPSATRSSPRNGAPESAKLRHLVSLSAADMTALGRHRPRHPRPLGGPEPLEAHLLGAADPTADAAGAAVHGSPPRSRARCSRRRSPRARPTPPQSLERDSADGGDFCTLIRLLRRLPSLHSLRRPAGSFPFRATGVGRSTPPSPAPAPPCHRGAGASSPYSSRPASLRRPRTPRHSRLRIRRRHSRRAPPRAPAPPPGGALLSQDRHTARPRPAAIPDLGRPVGAALRSRRAAGLHRRARQLAERRARIPDQPQRGVDAAAAPAVVECGALRSVASRLRVARRVPGRHRRRLRGSRHSSRMSGRSPRS